MEEHEWKNVNRRKYDEKKIDCIHVRMQNYKKLQRNGLINKTKSAQDSSNISSFPYLIRTNPEILWTCLEHFSWYKCPSLTSVNLQQYLVGKEFQINKPQKLLQLFLCYVK